MKKYITALGLVAVLILTQLTTACGKDDIEKSAKWGFETSERLRSSQKVVLELFRANLVSLRSKDTFFDAVSPGFDVLEAWADATEEQHNLIKAGQQTIAGAKLVLQTFFRANVLAAMNKIVTALNLLDVVKADKLFSILRLVASGALKVMDILSIPRTELVVVKGGS